ncbi:hypothetical protein LCGC14_2996510, partial [marine sediment metagenome]
MFEVQQLKLEEGLKGVVAAAMTVAERIRKRLRKLAFWDYSRVRDGREPLFLDKVTLGSMSLNRALEDVRLLMFSENRADSNGELFDVEGSRQEARQFVQQNFFKDRSGPPEVRSWNIYGHGVSSIEYFLGRWVTEILQARGRAFFRLHWETIEGRTYVARLNHVPDEDLRRVRMGRNRGQYRSVIRDRYGVDRNPPRVEYLVPDKVALFALQPPFAKTPGRSRLKQAQRLARREMKLMDAMLAASHASAYPDDHRWWVERARWLTSARLQTDMNRLGLRIGSIMGDSATMSIGTMTGTPMTSFYEVYDMLSFRWRVATLRESLLRQFNEQVVGRLLTRNG